MLSDGGGHVLLHVYLLGVDFYGGVMMLILM